MAKAGPKLAGACTWPPGTMRVAGVVVVATVLVAVVVMFNQTYARL